MAHAHTLLRIVAAFILLTTSLAFSWPGNHGSKRTTPRAKELAVAAADTQPALMFPSDLNTYTTATETFRAAGLAVPDFQAKFHASTAPCGGSWGLHVRDRSSGSTVNVCYTNDRAGTQQALRLRTLLHEMAHVWIYESFSTDDKETFMALRGLTAWQGSDAPWFDRGSEQAAEILIWGITNGENKVHPRIGQTEEGELRTAFAMMIR